jgi:SAM-dependent methyltransferase
VRRACPAGDYDYEQRGDGYARRRRADPCIAEQVHAALGDARTVVNVGAGTGSYEPDDRLVLAVEPSARMRAQRPAGRLPAVDATAERLPFDDAAFDAAMATVHQWTDVQAGLRELRRVAAPNFTLPTADGGRLSSTELRGRKTVLYFYPAVGTPGCTAEACDFRATWRRWRARATRCLASPRTSRRSSRSSVTSSP